MRTLRVSNNGHDKPECVHTMNSVQAIEIAGKTGMTFNPMDTLDTLSDFKAIHTHTYIHREIVRNGCQVVSTASRKQG